MVPDSLGHSVTTQAIEEKELSASNDYISIVTRPVKSITNQNGKILLFMSPWGYRPLAFSRGSTGLRSRIFSTRFDFQVNVVIRNIVLLDQNYRMSVKLFFSHPLTIKVYTWQKFLSKCCLWNLNNLNPTDEDDYSIAEAMLKSLRLRLLLLLLLCLFLFCLLGKSPKNW